MKYFTKEWASGKLDDRAFEKISADYREQLRELEPSSAVWRFANSVSLNDAYLDRIVLDRSAAKINMLLITGDLQFGYWRTELFYTGAQIEHGEDILRLALSVRPSEIWYDEFVVGPRKPSHGFLLAPREGNFVSPGEFSITFDEFDFAQSVAEDRRLATQDDRSEWR